MSLMVDKLVACTFESLKNALYSTTQTEDYFLQKCKSCHDYSCEAFFECKI